MFFLQNGRRDNKSSILLLHSYTRYLESNQVQTYFAPQLAPQTVIFGLHNVDKDTFHIQNHNLLLLKLPLYNARKYGFLCFKYFLNEISKIKNFERRVAVNNRNKYERFRKKWHRIKNKVP